MFVLLAVLLSVTELMTLPFPDVIVVPASIEKLCVQKGIKKNKNPHHILFLKGKNQLKNSINLEELELGGFLIKRK